MKGKGQAKGREWGTHAHNDGVGMDGESGRRESSGGKMGQLQVNNNKQGKKILFGQQILKSKMQIPEAWCGTIIQQMEQEENGNKFYEVGKLGLQRSLPRSRK